MAQPSPVASDPAPAAASPASSSSAAAVATDGDDDSKGGIGWWPASLGLLALGGGGGGGGGSSNPGTVPSGGGPTPLVLSELTYLPESNVLPVVFDPGLGKLGYPGKEPKFGFSLDSTTVQISFSFAPTSEGGSTYIAAFSSTFVGYPDLSKSVQTAPFAFSEATNGDFANFLKGILTNLATAANISLNEAASGTTTSFEFGGFSISLALDNSANNGNLINSMSVSFPSGSFTVSPNSQPTVSLIDFRVGTDVFPAATYLVDDDRLAAFLADPLMEGNYAVVVQDAGNVSSIDMSTGDGGLPNIQVLVYQNDADLGPDALLYATLSSQPTSYQQLFYQNDYILYV